MPKYKPCVGCYIYMACGGIAIGWHVRFMLIYITYCDTLVGPLGRLWVAVYRAILGGLWCGRVWSAVYKKTLLLEYTMRVLW